MLVDRSKRTVSEAEWAAIMVRIANRRDREGFARVYDEFSGRLKSFLISRGAAPAVADELLQASLLQVWEKAHLFNPGSGSLATWLYRIARNRYIDHLRKTSVNERYSPPYPEWLENNQNIRLTELPDTDEQIVRDAIRQLPNRQAQVLYMSFYQGKTHREISEELRTPLGSVKSSLRLAFEKLRRRMGEVL